MESSLNEQNLFWEKKEFVSFVLSIFVFFIHCSTFDQYTDSGSWISLINNRADFFFRESITRFAVPMFFMLSGISFYKDYDNKKYVGKMKSRFFTLVIPYLLWNTIWMIFDIMCSYSFLSNYFVGRKPFVITVLNVLHGVFFYKCNGPFWYIFNLIVFSFAAPVIYCIVRNKYVGMGTVILLSLLQHYGIGLPQAVFFVPVSIIYYLIGAIVGRHFFDFVSKKSSKGLRFCSLAFLVVYVMAKNIFAEQLYLGNIILVMVVYVLSAFALWNVTDIFVDKIKPRKIYIRSFAIYAMHINVSAIITKIFVLCLPKNEWIVIPNFLATAVLTPLSIHLFCVLLEQFLPKVYAVLIGNRLRR